MRLLILALFLATGLSGGARAEDVIASCTGSFGWAYRIVGGLTTLDDDGWQPETIPAGEIRFVSRNRQPDVLVKSASRKYSARDEGGTVNVIGDERSDALLVIVYYNDTKTVEHYLFSKSQPRRVVWGTIRTGGLLPKSSLMVAECE